MSFFSIHHRTAISLVPQNSYAKIPTAVFKNIGFLKNQSLVLIRNHLNRAIFHFFNIYFYLFLF